MGNSIYTFKMVDAGKKTNNPRIISDNRYKDMSHA